MSVHNGVAAAPQEVYFQHLNQQLRDCAAGIPQLLLDLDRLDHNLECVQRRLQGKSVRLVVKSLPSEALLRYASERLGSQRFMVFHRPFLNRMVKAFPQADILMGKPLPCSSMHRFYQQRDKDCRFEPQRQLQWLIDSKLRLQQYLAFAQQQQLKLRINIEIDVGMRRGGLQKPAQLRDLLRVIRAHPQHLQFSGLMGYDAHVVKAPRLLSSVSAAFNKSQNCYRHFIDVIDTEVGLESLEQPLTFNGAGSPTYALHGRESNTGVATALNDLSLGSCLLQPSDFDLPSLADHRPALFIATPVLKRLTKVEIPFLDVLAPKLQARLQALSGRARHGLFIYGGRWMAKPHYPSAMKESRLYGLSSNQQLMTLPATAETQVDDYVFFRPTQSEALLLNFSELQCFRQGQWQQSWPIFQPQG